MKKNNKKGFTLVELVIVVAVMAVLVAVAIPTVSSITKSAQDSVDASNARTIESMIKLARAEQAKTGDGTGSLSATIIDTALTNAKLGIEDGAFIYDDTKGSCFVSTATTTPGRDQYLIIFDLDNATAADQIKVTKGADAATPVVPGTDAADDN